MRVGLVAALVFSLGSGCAHLSTSSEPGMVEVGPSTTPPLILTHAHERWTRRKALLTSGITIATAGAALTLAGGIGYGVERDIVAKGVDVGLHGMYPYVPTGPGSPEQSACLDALFVGVGNVGAGLVLTIVGLTRHD
ncbi:MAG TPA: hypothetical protein VHB97_26415 [Polyangia bacterium]|jgi:hypothetical protein|nr:hypothetical protein [Polyangia bacterium]